MFDYYFVNGVRVKIEDPAQAMKPYPKRPLLVDHLTKIAAGLGAMWSVGIKHESITYSYLHFGGGYTQPDGITLQFHNSYEYSSDNRRPDYWKYKVDGVYVQPTDPNCHKFSTTDEPQVNVRLDDPKRAVSAIAKLVPAIQEWTLRSHAHLAKQQKDKDDHVARLEVIAAATDYKFGYHQLNSTQIDFHSSCLGGNNSSRLILNKGHETVQLTTSLGDKELPQVINFIRQLRGYDPLPLSLPTT